jgi:hypothetical protein
MAAEFCLHDISFMLVSFFNMPQICDMGPTAPPKEVVVLRIFITLKNPSSSAGFEPSNLGSSGKHANH